MQKIINLDTVSGGQVEPVYCLDSKSGKQVRCNMYAVTDNKFKDKIVAVAYFQIYEDAVNYDRRYNYGFGPKYIIGPDRKYYEADCYETIANPNIVYKK